MPGDERTQEREFLADLKARTGRDLDQWMAEITAQGFVDKNQTIDWLRAQGFPFARASWLERIHSNGGRPIYQDDATPVPAPATPAAAERRPAPKRASADPARAARDAAAMEKLLAGAKGYRPLYHLLEAEVRKAFPEVAIIPQSGYISLRQPKEFAAVTCHPTELRLGLDLGERPFDPPLQPARLKGVPASITHMVVLNDARQVGGALMALLAAAHARAHG